MSITISVLLENRLKPESKNLLRAKAGLSLFIQDENDSILFDTGPDDSFMHNAGLMGVDLTNLTASETLPRLYFPTVTMTIVAVFRGYLTHVE